MKSSNRLCDTYSVIKNVREKKNFEKNISTVETREKGGECPLPPRTIFWSFWMLNQSRQKGRKITKQEKKTLEEGHAAKKVMFSTQTLLCSMYSEQQKKHIHKPISVSEITI